MKIKNLTELTSDAQLGIIGGTSAAGCSCTCSCSCDTNTNSDSISDGTSNARDGIISAFN